MIKAIVFDLDNTLVDFMKMKTNAVWAAIYAMIDAGLDITPERAKEVIDEIYREQGIEYQQVFDLFLTKTIGRVDYKYLASAIVAYRKAREAALSPYPHVHKTITELIKRGIKIAILSDAPSKEAWLRLAYMGFQHYFDVVVTYDDTKERKPSPIAFHTVITRLGSKPEETLMVGDWNERDIIGAKNVGMITAFAKYGDTFNTEKHDADYELNDITDILKIIEKQ